MSTDQRLRATEKWQNISKNIKLTESIIRRNQLNVHWPYIFQFQELSVDFIREFISIITEQDLWDVIAKYQTLDHDFIREYRASLNWDIVLQYQSLTTRFVPADNAIPSSVVEDVPNFIFTLPKSRLRSTIDELSSYTTFDVHGCKITSNNKSYVIVSVEESGDNVLVTTSTSFALAGATDPGDVQLDFGWVEFPESESGSVAFLEEAEIAPYLHIDNNASRNFRTALLSGQSLTYDFIVSNLASITRSENLREMSLNQNLTDLFISIYDVDSNLSDAVASINFNWDQILIGQDIYELIESENYDSWVKDKLNFQLLLKYQNLSRTFVLANLDSLQLPELGRYNRNLSDADLAQIELDNPSLLEPTDRPANVKFNYDYGDIVQDLKDAGFDFEEGLPIGYVLRYRNGSLSNKRNTGIEVVSGTQVSIPQVDLSEGNPRGRNGISVLNGRDILKNEDRQAYKIAKVRVPIVSRNIDQSATGTITFSPKQTYSEYDRFIIPDSTNKTMFEFDTSGDFTSSEMDIYNRVTFTSDGTSNISLNKAHRLRTGDPIVIEGGSLPSPLITGTTYYLINAGDTLIRVATTRDNALNNVSFDIAAGTGQILRTDSAFATSTDFQLFNSMSFIFPTTPAGGSFDPLVTTDVHYVVKTSRYTFRVATTEQNALDGSFVTITGKTDGYTIRANSIPINIRSNSIIRSNDVANIMNRSVNELLHVTVADDSDQLQDPWYPTVKDGSSTYESAWEDYSSTFTATAADNRFIIATSLPIENGDPISFTGSPPSPLIADTIYYAIVIDNQTIEVADDPEDADARIAVNLTADGSGSIFPARIKLTDNINLHTGNRVEVSSTTLPTGISASTVYYVNVITPTKIELCSTIDNAFNGVPIALQRSGSDPKLLTADDHNVTYGVGGKAIIHYMFNNNIYLETITPDVELTDAVSLSSRKSSPVAEPVLTVERVTDLTSIQNDSTIQLTSNLQSSQKSQGNIPIQRYTNNLNTIKVSGFSGGFEDTITNENAKGVGVVIEELGRLRAFSVEVVDNDYFKNFRF